MSLSSLIFFNLLLKSFINHNIKSVNYNCSNNRKKNLRKKNIYDIKQKICSVSQKEIKYILNETENKIICNDNKYRQHNILHKEILMEGDKEIIINYLKNHHGVMKLTAKSSAEEVEALLGMSRKAFKRAYGGLYKEELITFDDEKTILKDYK
jgi:hypothetical protein